jgi:alpha-tubulin suppressor-like RCC1 family protein
MNIISVIELIQDKINESNSSEEVIYLSKVIEVLNTGTIKTVSTYSDLLSIISKSKDIYFVEDEKKLYYFNINSWLLLSDSISIDLRSWGSNSSGQLGDNTITSRSSPVSVVGGFTDWTSVSAGSNFSLGVRANGTLWAWGSSSNGRLGDNSTTNRSSPVLVVGSFVDWVQVSAGGIHSLGVRANGTVWAWGQNNNGQLGDNSTTFSSSPVSVVGGFVDWIQASAGNSHSLGVRANGTLWAWGLNSSGRLGDNTTINRLSPVSVVGGFTDWIEASAGGDHSLGVRANGTLWAWGFNGEGRLGDNTTINRLSPVSVVGGFTDWISASAYNHSLGVRTNGTVWAWGNNGNGRLGDNTITSRLSPVSVVGGFTDWISASAGGAQSLGVRANGTVWAWGNNSFGRLGDNTITSRLSPVSVVGGFTDWVSASAGDNHSLGIRAIINN